MPSNNILGEVFTGGATTSQHVDAEDDNHFENTTFKLKRTRSLGLLDEFIQPIDQENQKQDENTPPENGSEVDDSNSKKLSLDTNVADNTESEQIRKSPTPILVKSPELLPHDDTDLMYEPSRHVDYLSHQWDVSDISKSWRYVISKRKDVANSARLENASWRTWAQRRSNLKTISPEVVNWSKDSDVTWLYGPILKDDGNDDIDDECHKRITTATSAVAGDISIPNKQCAAPKPILKRRTVQDMMISHSNLLKLQLATTRIHQKQQQQIQQQQQQREHRRQNSGEPPEFDDYDAISAKLNTQYKNLNSQSPRTSSQNLPNAYKVSESLSSSEVDSISRKEPELPQQVSSTSVSKPESKNEISTVPKEERHIHFNDEVQQCIAVDNYSDEDEDYYSEEDDYYDNDEEEGYIYETPHDYHDSDEEEEDDEEDDDEEGGFFLKVRAPANPNLAVPGLSSSGNKDSTTNNDNTEDTDSISTNNSKVYRTIHLLPSTTLNYGSSDEESDEENPYTSSMSHNVNNSSRGYDYYYDYNTVYTVDPNHAIYGNNNKNEIKTPDVVDVPENIAMGSNFDYEIIESEDFKSNVNDNIMPIIDPVVINNNNLSYSRNSNNDNEKLPISSLNNSASTKEKSFPFQLSDSEEDSEDGLSIGTRSSSQSLAQSIFAQNLTSSGNEQIHFPKACDYPQPVSAPVSSINPRHSSSSISKQPHSSSSLSDSFFGATLTKQKSSSSSLADQFFNITTPLSAPPSESIEYSSPPPESSQLQRTLSNTQRKSSPLPPHTTSANAFSGNSTPPLEGQSSNKTFLFDSDSESDDEFIEDVDPHSQPATNQTLCYTSLSQVADKSGIKSPSPSTHENSDGHKPSNSGAQNIVEQAKDLANHFLGNWKHNE